MRGRRLLAVGEGQNTGFAQRITAIPGQHVQHVVHITHPVEIPVELVVEPLTLAGKAFKLVHQPLRRKPLAFHEVAIGVSERSLRRTAQRGMIVENARKPRFLAAQGLSTLCPQEAFRTLAQVAARQRLEDVEHLFGVLLVLQQQPEMMPRLERTHPHFWTAFIENRQVSAKTGAYRA